jgi:outer membrane protein OmpA-like peptidoglycan-associated protein
MARTKPHNIFQQIICFNYVCRRMIGRNKLRQAITFEDYGKQIKKNAKKGVYKNLTPTVPATTTPPVKKQKKDTIVVAKDTTRNTKIKPMPIVVSPILKMDSLITLSEFLFETDSYKLKETHYSQLDSLSKFLRRHPTLEVNVTGHTDNTGNERHNVTLSMHRAEAVTQYLINKGVSVEKIFFEGLGSSHPIEGNETETGRSKNRRVEILISNPKKK